MTIGRELHPAASARQGEPSEPARGRGSSVLAPRRGLPIRARRRGPSPLARRPDILPLAATLAAWVALVTENWVHVIPAPTGSSATVAASDGHHFLLIGTAPGASPLPVLSAAAVMALAMMSPLALPGVRTVAGASRWWRAGRAVVWFFVAFAAGWVVAIVPLAVIAGVLAGWLGAATAARAARGLRSAVVAAGTRDLGARLRPSRSVARPRLAR